MTLLNNTQKKPRFSLIGVPFNSSGSTDRVARAPRGEGWLGYSVLSLLLYGIPLV